MTTHRGVDGYTVAQMGNMEAILRDFLPDYQEDENFKATPVRFLKYLAHYFQPYDPEKDLSKTFPPVVGTDVEGEERYASAMVVQTGIPFRAVCAHHLVPVLGTARVGYIPHEKVVGLSKISRLVYGIAHQKPSLQEDVNNQIVDALMKHLKPYGAMAVIEAEHGCMACRGIEEHAVATVTSAVRGVFIKEVAARQEFYELTHMPHQRGL